MCNFVAASDLTPQFVKELFEYCEACLEAGFINLDLEPRHLLCTENGRLLVIDHSSCAKLDVSLKKFNGVLCLACCSFL